MKRLAIVGLLVSTLACQGPAPETGESPVTAQEQWVEEVREEIAERWEAYRTTLVEDDGEGWESFWATDARVFEPGVVMSGNEIVEFGREFWEMGGQIYFFQIEPYEIFVHEDAAYQIGQLDEVFRPPDGNPTEVHNNFFARWERGPSGVWKLSHFMAGPRDAPESEAGG